MVAIIKEIRIKLGHDYVKLLKSQEKIEEEKKEDLREIKSDKEQLKEGK